MNDKNNRMSVSVVMPYYIAGRGGEGVISINDAATQEAIDRLFEAVDQQPKVTASGIPVHCAHDAIVNTKTLSPNPRNPNQHPEEQVALLGKVIRSFGWRAPITVSKRSGMVVRGHCRLLAAKLEGLDEVPVDYQDYRTAEEEEADMIADNRIAELAEIDKTMLADLLSGISESNLPIDLTGYTEEEYKELVESLSDAAVILNFEDDVIPGPVAEPFTKPGDYWALGEHVLVCGDSTKSETYDMLMTGRKANLCITDPPYNVDYTGGTKDRLKILGDNQTDAAFKAFLLDAFTCMHDNMEKGAAAYIFHSETEGVNFRTAFIGAGFTLKQCLIWVKNVFVLGRQDYHWQHEPILYGWIEGKPHYFIDDRTQSTVIDEEIPDLSKMKKLELLRYIRERLVNPDVRTTVLREDKPNRNDVHPTMKPVRLLARLIQNSSRAGDLVLDPFAGSGSTLIACEHLKRRARCIEMDPRYCDVIVKRYCSIKGSADIICIRNGTEIKKEEYKHILGLDELKGGQGGD